MWGKTCQFKLLWSYKRCRFAGFVDLSESDSKRRI